MHFLHITVADWWGSQLHNRKLCFRFICNIHSDYSFLCHLLPDLIVHFSTQKQILLIHHKCLNYCLSILSILRKNEDSHNRVIVKIASDYMKRALNPTPEDFAFDSTTMICLFDVLWNGLLTNLENLQCFVKMGSIYTLIDLLEVCRNINTVN